jgi:AraC-like DNA-binding protein
VTATHGYREWQPPQRWSAAVAVLWEQRVDDDHVQRVLPDGHADLLMYDDGRIEVAGVHDRADLAPLAKGTLLRGIRFRSAAVANAFDLDASSLRNRTVSLDDVLGSSRARRLRDPRARDVWLSGIEPNCRVEHVVQLLQTRSIEDSADAIGLTSRQLLCVFAQSVGVTPKIYQRVARLQRFLAEAERSDNLAVAALTAGYADQSHMTREIGTLAGLSPTSLLLERRQPALT